MALVFATFMELDWSCMDPCRYLSTGLATSHKLASRDGVIVVGVLHFVQKSNGQIVLLIEVIQEAIDATGMTEVSVEDRTKLFSDNGAGYICRAFRDYLHPMVEVTKATLL